MIKFLLAIKKNSCRNDGVTLLSTAAICRLLFLIVQFINSFIFLAFISFEKFSNEIQRMLVRNTCSEILGFVRGNWFQECHTCVSLGSFKLLQTPFFALELRLVSFFFDFSLFTGFFFFSCKALTTGEVLSFICCGVLCHFKTIK